MWASSNGHEEFVRHLLKHERLDVNVRNSAGCTSLIIASEEGHLKVIRELLKHKAVDDS